jgi:hypothetical protein
MPVPAGDTLGQLEALVQTDTGFAALYRRQIGDGMGKAVLGTENRVLTSTDGVDWTEHTVPTTETALFYRDLAFGNGRLLVGGALGSQGAIATSVDGSDWTMREAPMPDVRAVAFLEGSFFALSNSATIWRSPDGDDWVGGPTEAVQLSAIAHGNGLFVAVGSGPIEVSRDGTTWTPVDLDCDLPGNCVTDPSGEVHQGFRSSVFFANGAFHADGLFSTDAMRWQRRNAGAPIPVGHFGGYLMRIDGDTLLAFRDDEPQQLSVQLRPADGQSCTEARRCFVLDDQLLLQP